MDPTMKNPIFIFSGLPAAGKSTVAAALLRHFKLGVHIPVDAIGHWVVAGRSDPIGRWDPATEQQFQLARQAVAQTSLLYARAGFAVVIDDVIMPDHFETHYRPYLGKHTTYQIMLRPRVEIALARNVRRKKEADAAPLNRVIPLIDAHLNYHDLPALGWHVVDNSYLSIEETAREILSILGIVL
jgi:adenylylsulfate kinase-like enzyme